MFETTQLTLSVCVQTYQHSEFIGECLDGILMQQTNFPFEILLGEDESTDGTRELCIEYANKYPEKIRLFLRSRKDVIYVNGNPTGRFNFLENLKVARGKYIALCEGDDYWTDPHKLQKQVDFLEAHREFTGAFHETQVLDELGRDERIEKIFGATASEIVRAEDTISQWSIFHTSSFIFTKNALIIPDWFTKIISADMALFSIISKSGAFKKIPNVMSIYRKHEAGITETVNVKEFFYENRIELINFLDEYHDYKYHEKAANIIAALEQHVQHKRKRSKNRFFNRVRKFLNDFGII